MAQGDAYEALRQVYEGWDFPSSEWLMKRIKAPLACAKRADAEFSIATYVAHTTHWQRVWLNKLKGERKAKGQNWPVVPEKEWPAVRDAYLAGFQEALVLAAAKPFAHAMRDDEAACKTLTQIAVHNAYHIGQIALLVRMGGDMSEPG